MSDYIEEKDMPPGMADKIRTLLEAPSDSLVRLDVETHHNMYYESMGCEGDTTFFIHAWWEPYKVMGNVELHRQHKAKEYTSFLDIVRELT